MATYPVVSEIWSVFEGTLQNHARKLVNDIAKKQGADPLELWKKIKPILRIGLLDIDIPDITHCPFPSAESEGAIKLRCRKPCLAGFSTCAAHAAIGTTAKTSTQTYISVDRITDMSGKIYFLDSNIARDINGKPKGIVQEGVLYLFEKI